MRGMYGRAMVVWVVAFLASATLPVPAAGARPSGGGGAGGGGKCRPAAEVCDGKDNDCDGAVDEGVCSTSYHCDKDQDGYPALAATGVCSAYRCAPVGCATSPGSDCNDGSVTINPAAVENCDADGIDDDCDGAVDECDPCANGVRDGNETGIDCGGSCAGCDIGGPCGTAQDCVSTYCAGGICAAPPRTLPPDCRAIKHDNASLTNRINLVLVPSAFNGDMALFRQKAEWIASIFSSYTPLDAAIAGYNIFYVSKESGAYCNFNCNGIARLLCCDTTLARTLSATCTTGPRQTIVVHNSDTYGGAGYYSSDVATTSINASAPRVAVHEIGHSLFTLGDEYTTGSATASSPNCDYAGCAKWQDMLGYNGVNCLSGSCANGAYSVSETTIMKSLSYPFEEVNLRLTCCTYARETGAFPAYCDQFRRFTASGDLNDFCLNPTGSGTAAVPAEYVDDPEEVTFARDAASGAWQVESTRRGRPGFYPTERVRGHGRGGIRVALTFPGAPGLALRFDGYEDVEFPGPTRDSLGGTVRMPRNVLTVIVNRRQHGPVESAEAWEQAR